MFILRNHWKKEEKFITDYSCGWTNITTKYLWLHNQINKKVMFLNLGYQNKCMFLLYLCVFVILCVWLTFAYNIMFWTKKSKIMQESIINNTCIDYGIHICIHIRTSLIYICFALDLNDTIIIGWNMSCDCCLHESLHRHQITNYVKKRISCGFWWYMIFIQLAQK